MRQHECRDRSLRARLDDHRAAGGEGGACFTQDHGDGEIPGDQSGGHTDGLLDREDATVGRRGHAYRTVDALCLASKPPGEARGVVDLPVRFGEGFPRLVGENLGEVGPRRPYESVPFHEPLGALPGVGLLVGFECFMGGLDGGIHVFHAIGRTTGPGCVGTGVYPDVTVDSIRGE